ncbi:MAG: hypothetical protein ACI8SJ_000953 [Shewanella sp.]
MAFFLRIPVRQKQASVKQKREAAINVDICTFSGVIYGYFDCLWTAVTLLTEIRFGIDLFENRSLGIWDWFNA